MPWQFEKEQAWLEEMAQQGWLLEKMELRYIFKKIDPQEFISRTDYYIIRNEEKKQAYLSVFEESGWELIQSFNGWCYVRIPKSEYKTDIYSDSASRIDQLHRIKDNTLKVALIYILFIAIFMGFDTFFDLPVFILSLAMVVLGLIYRSKINEKIEGLRMKMGEEEKSAMAP